ncbi:Heterogeneous nuclear ribonucleoprotein A0 [Morus notabilis]|uniref:Heterogeneous nuclear ribonucleoprotein A0 n=1 Tax=Morus notabilis TaxID=981085 RepID=W9RZ48_9ROSA|nr:UBP1-associated protein 2C [Morus notabilis]EXC18503.1 Heterogeneous nuclear ribonucleoprotein A0 [Morus notabilis]
MDPSKKRKMEENGIVSASAATNGGNHHYHPASLSPQDARKLIEHFTPDQLLDILQDAVARHVDVLDAVRSIADRDISQRKLFIRGLGWDTTTDGLRALFSAYGELEEAVVILDKNTGKSKGYGFVTFRHVDGALLALKEPSKKIDGRMTVTQLAAAGNSASNSAPNPAAPAASAADVSLRKIYVANVPYDMASDKLLAHFSVYGAIEEGPLGFDKQTGKCRGYAFFVYKSPEGAQAALVHPVKTIEGRQLNCKLAVDGRKGKQGVSQDAVQVPAAGGPGNAPSASLSGQFSGPGGIGPYTGFSGGPQPAMGHHHGLNSSVGGPLGLGSVAGQRPSSIGVAGGYGAGLGGPYGGYGGPNSAGYGRGGPGRGLSGAGAGGAGGAGSALYPESGHHGLSSSSAYPGPHHQQPGASSVLRVPPGGMYPPPYY